MTTAHNVALPAQQSVGRLLCALIVGGITSILDTTIVAIGLHTLSEQLAAPLATIQWVSTGYLLALAIAIPFASWAQTRFGGKRLWLFSLGLFVVGSGLCACAWSAESLIAFRVLQGLGAGIMFPLMMTLAMQHVPPESRTRTMATMSLPIALGPILGPVLGGVVLNWLDWRWMFLINVPVGIVGLVLAVKFINADRPVNIHDRQPLDVVGAILLAPALAGLLYGLSNSHDSGGFGRADVLIPCIAGGILLAGFVVWALHRAGSALVDVRLFGVRSVRTASIALTLAGGALFAANFLLPLYFQALRGYSVLDAALILIPQGAGTLIIRLFVGKLVDRFGSRSVAVAGALVMAAATVPFAFADTDTSLGLLVTFLFIRGLGNGVLMIPIMAVAYIDIDAERMSHASALTRIVQQLGGAFSTALVAVVLTTYSTPRNPSTGFDAAFWWVIAMALAVAASAFLLPSHTQEKSTIARIDKVPADSTDVPQTSAS